MFDFNDRKEKLTELKIDRPISNFHPHGISVWQEPKSGITKCMCTSESFLVLMVKDPVNSNYLLSNKVCSVLTMF
jgi:hypothetical protein